MKAATTKVNIRLKTYSVVIPKFHASNWKEVQEDKIKFVQKTSNLDLEMILQEPLTTTQITFAIPGLSLINVK